MCVQDNRWIGNQIQAVVFCDSGGGQQLLRRNASASVRGPSFVRTRPENCLDWVVGFCVWFIVSGFHVCFLWIVLPPPLWNPVKISGGCVQNLVNINCSTGGWLEPISSFQRYIIITCCAHIIIMIFDKVTSTCLQRDVNRSVITVWSKSSDFHHVEVKMNFPNFDKRPTLTDYGSFGSKNPSQIFLSQGYEFLVMMYFRICFSLSNPSWTRWSW